jgi:hypothetical protein
MHTTIDESDWKLLRRLHQVALEKFSKQILDELEQIRIDPSKSNHERFLAAFDLINRRNKDIAMAFDDLRRSRAFDRIAAIHSLGLFSKEETAGFTEQTQEIMKVLLGAWPA